MPILERLFDRQRRNFDYVIVGSGTAGAVIAARLSELSDVRILVLEAGDWPDDPLVDDSRNWGRILQSGWVLDWTSTPQAHAADRDITAVRGRAVGGSSVVNALYHNWAVKEDFDRWSLPGWSWAEAEPAFRATETYVTTPSSERGRDGAIKVSAITGAGVYGGSLMAAAEETGHPVLDDINGGTRIGMGLQQIAYHGGKRQHMGRVFLKPPVEAGKVVCWTNSLARKIRTEAGKAVGVEVMTPDGPELVHADEGVIVCGGAFQSPQLLMLSGIGPAAHLKDVGVEVVQDAPGVGANLHDHYLVFSAAYSAMRAVPQSPQHPSVASLYASTGGAGGQRDIMLNFFTDGQVWPSEFSADPGFKAAFSYMTPQSKGELRLASADPAAMPIIDPAYLKEQADRDALATAYETAREVFESKAFDELRGEQVFPRDVKTRADVDAFIRRGGVGYGHFAGTCRMGTDGAAVVDENCKVRGFDNLFVIDASVMPDIVSAPTNASVAAMAHHAAPRILKEGAAG